MLRLDNQTEIIKKCVRGDEVAQRKLYVQYRAQWYMTSMRYGKSKYEADDIFQNGLIQIYQGMHQFDPAKGTFITWSTRVLTNAALRYLKKNRWHEAFANLDDVNDTIATNDEEALDAISAKELTVLVQKLPLGYRLVFNMHALEGFKHEEIAKKLNISVGTSRSQLSKAKRMLKRKLEHRLMESIKK